MVITDHLVFVHMPRTGGTFVESVLRKIHQKRGDFIEERQEDAPTPLKNRLMGMVSKRSTFLNLLQQTRHGVWNQHGTIALIPQAHAHKPVITILRNPLDGYVSEYEFKLWKTDPAAFRVDVEAVRRKFAAFPDITFAQFIDFLDDTVERWHADHPAFPERVLGYYTLQFLLFYLAKPLAEQRDAAYLGDRKYLADVRPDLHFLFMHNLNQNLHDTLLGLGYAPEEVAFIPNQQKIYPKGGGRSEGQTWQQYYAPALMARAREREKMLFGLFPELEQPAPAPIGATALSARRGSPTP